MPATKEQEALLERALGFFRDARKEGHDDFVNEVEKRYKVYRGILEKTSDAAQWTSKAHPPYVQHIVETTLANLIDDRLKYRIRPTPTLRFTQSPDAAELARQGARAHQILFDWQISQDNFTDLQRPFLLQNAIAGLTVAKTFWTKREERRRTLETIEEPLTDDVGNPIINPMTGQPVTTIRMQEKTGSQVIYDGPTTEVRDVRDFFWMQNAVSLAKSPYVIDRVWMTPDDVLKAFKDGVFGSNRGGVSLEDARSMLAETKDFTDELVNREQMIWNVERTKNLVEVLEVWDEARKQIITVGNRKILFAHREGYPFYHESYPFEVCSTQPELFRIPGISQVEKIAHLQTLLWDITNQSLDNLRFVNNAIAMFRPDVEDVDAYEWYPGARWLIDDPKQVEMWSPNPIPAEVSIGREALIKGDMQNLAGGFPFSSGTDSAFVDQKTATGASIVSSIAQRSMNLSKQQIYSAWRGVGQQRMVLNQQFIREPQVAPVLGFDDVEEIHVIWPEILQGDYKFELEPIPDVLMKQEEQASAQALYQMALQAFPVVASAAMNGAATNLNLDALWEELLKAHGKDDTERYFSRQQPAMLPSGPGGPTQQALPSGSEPQGVTGQGSIDPAVSPSSGMSLSPIASLQRAQALDRS